mmetsp:Transcript_46230/g.124160  ORF Transcript_46230/g.124160 Transcript_46230/m.124160 type:complete len:97 (+) Transcript_46230:128-418(+)
MGREEQVQKAKDLAATIQKMTADAEVLSKEVKDLTEQKAGIEGELNQMGERMRVIQAELPRKLQELQQLSQQQQQKEARYMALLEAAPSLVQVMKK